MNLILDRLQSMSNRYCERCNCQNACTQLLLSELYISSLGVLSSTHISQCQVSNLVQLHQELERWRNRIEKLNELTCKWSLIEVLWVVGLRLGELYAHPTSTELSTHPRLGSLSLPIMSLIHYACSKYWLACVAAYSRTTSPLETDNS